MSDQEYGRVTRKRRTTRKSRYTKIMPKPTVVIGESAPPVPKELNFKELEPSRKRDRDNYQPTEQDNDMFCDLVEEVLNATGLEWEAEFEHGEYQRAEIHIEGKAGGSLIGRRGAGIEALELLIGRMASQAAGHLVPVQVDVNDYRGKQEADLRDLARRAAERFLDTNEPQHLPTMGPRDRRVVHLFIKSMDNGPATYTVGEGRDRHIVVGPHQD